MIVDSHCHLEDELSPERLLAAMDAGGVGKAILIPAANARVSGTRGAGLMCACMHVPVLRMPLYRTARKTMHQVVRPDNAAVFEVAAAHPSRFLPFAFVNPALGAEADEELDRWIDAGARGVKLHAWLHGYRLVDALGILRRCERAGLPVLAHLGFGPAGDVAAVMDACPRLKLTLAHGGIPHFEAVWKVERVTFDVAARGLLVGDRMIRKLAGAVGPSRVVFGSDAPIGLRRDGAYRYDPPPLPDDAMARNALRLLDEI